MASKLLNSSVSDAAKDAIKRVCMLKATQPEHSTIHLNHGKNVIGRCKESEIRDARCSKRQLELDVDLKIAKAKVKVLGLNPCGINGIMAMQNSEFELMHGDLLEMVYGRHKFELVFKPPPKEASQTKITEATSATVGEWDSVENGKVLIYTSEGMQSAEKIAGYDVDGTIIKTKSGNVFPKNIDDWEIIFPEVSVKLKKLHQDGYKICFFTNQGGIAKGKVDVNEFKEKIKKIIKKVGVPVQVFVSIADGYYRKPMTGMWEYLEEHKNGEVKINLEKSFYVGDAAGRPEIGSGATKRKKDHSLVDRFFALNIGISFYTPEEHFLGKKTEPWTQPEFEPSKVHDKFPLLEPETAKIPDDGECEMIIMMGLPGSGKSHFCKLHLAPKGYIVVNADTLGSTANCLKACERALTESKSCVVDNTNVDADSRKKFVELAKRLKANCRCFVMNATIAQVKHNLAFRHLTDTTHSKINDMVFNMMKKKYKLPTLDEGFKEIVRVNLKPEFINVKDEQLYKLYLVEK